MWAQGCDFQRFNQQVELAIEPVQPLPDELKLWALVLVSYSPLGGCATAAPVPFYRKGSGIRARLWYTCQTLAYVSEKLG